MMKKTRMKMSAPVSTRAKLKSRMSLMLLMVAAALFPTHPRVRLHRIVAFIAGRRLISDGRKVTGVI